MKTNPPVLFVSQYAYPTIYGSNNNVYRQAKALKHDIGIDVAILTWPEGDSWSGPIPAAQASDLLPYLKWSYNRVDYHVVTLPIHLINRVLNDAEWQQAVVLGCKILEKIQPAIVHLQHWRGLWWILESANRLSIPTVFSSHDWGIGCLRTLLLTGDNELCDGIVAIPKCASCIWKGRNLIGKANELLVSTAIGERLFNILSKSGLEMFLRRHGAVNLGLQKRVTLNHARANSVLSKLAALIVPNQFGKSFYRQFGIPEKRIHVVPWYYDLEVPIIDRLLDPEKIVLGFIGRITPEKGIQRLFDALSSEAMEKSFHLVIAGAVQGNYAEQLRARFKQRVGIHSVEWMGFLPHEEIHRFFQKVDVVVIPSEWIDNTPLTLIESFAFRRPVIITNVPSIRDLVQEGHTGYLTTFGSTKSLCQAINRVCRNPDLLHVMGNNISEVKSSAAYAGAIHQIYQSITG